MTIDELAKGLGVDSFELLGTVKGGNSYVHKIRYGGEHYALKHYAGPPERQSRSLNQESNALQFLNREEIIRCPEIISCNVREPSILYRWIEGESASEINEIKDAIINSIVQLSKSGIVHKYKLNAIDSVLDSEDLLHQLGNRFNTFSSISNLPSEFKQNLTETFDLIRKYFPSRVIYDSRLLSISDYGPHNLIRNHDGEYTHIDFEFFGIDSHVKVYSDLFCHPKSLFSSNELKKIICSTHASKNLNLEIFSILPAIALKWVFIVLKRYIDWDLKKYVSSVSSFSDPNLYLAYTRHLIDLQNFDQLISYKEFEEL